jgi:acetylornithine/N-succinyldiaminopimelate aminotransferase|uniref:acetylornithine transaminase n=1 Tax=Candidatus Planktophila sp. TaxID=2175601 RepID=UPI004049E483
MTKNAKSSVSWSDVMQGNYGEPKITLKSGKGVIVTDTSGKKYLDFLGGIATNVLGHAHPVIVRAVSKQIATLGHVSNFYSHPSGIALAAKLQELTGDNTSRVFFCNSGAEANEAALKLSRKTGRSKIVATIGSFHGRTMGALSLTGQPSKRNPFKPLLKDIKHVAFGDIAQMRKAVSKKTAMVIVEPIMGEAGVIVPPFGYLKELRDICNQHGALLVFDCVQTGIGRTGTWFGYEEEKIRPDVITLAKGLGGGLPVGAMITLGSNSPQFAPGEHGTTFGGNPVAAAAGLAAIEFITKNRLMVSAKSFEKRLKIKLGAVRGVTEVRGRGLLLGIALDGAYAKDLSEKLASRGVLVNAPNEETIRIAPALTVTKVQIDRFIAIFTECMQEVGRG